MVLTWNRYVVQFVTVTTPGYFTLFLGEILQNEQEYCNPEG